MSQVRRIGLTLKVHFFYSSYKLNCTQYKLMWKTRDAQCYKKLEQIGEGTYGQVFVAVDIFTKELVAMKKVHINI